MLDWEKEKEGRLERKPDLEMLPWAWLKQAILDLRLKGGWEFSGGSAFISWPGPLDSLSWAGSALL